jgi:hypothetical protein
VVKLRWWRSRSRARRRRTDWAANWAKWRLESVHGGVRSWKSLHFELSFFVFFSSSRRPPYAVDSSAFVALGYLIYIVNFIRRVLMLMLLYAPSMYKSPQTDETSS